MNMRPAIWSKMCIRDRGYLERPQPDEITKVIPDFFK